MSTNLRFVFSFWLFFGIFSATAQNNYWKKTGEKRLSALAKTSRSSIPKKYLSYTLNVKAFKAALKKAPRNIARNKKSRFVLEFPSAQGNFEKFKVTESPIMQKELAKRYPQLKTYKAVGIDDPTATMRFSMTPLGLHTMSLSGNKNTVFIDPYTPGGKNYMVYNRASLKKDMQQFQCLTPQEKRLKTSKNDRATQRGNTDDRTLRTYRLALSNTAEYGNIFATTPGNEKQDIMAQMLVTINRVNEIYERDLAIRLVFTNNNDRLIFYGDPDKDPWEDEYNYRTQRVIDSIVGSDNYDIGHNFNTSGDGNAGFIGSVCEEGLKASAYTGLTNPTGDAFNIDYVAHEMGHQFGAYHTMNTCLRSGNGISEVEPASGSSIMGYAGICPVNVQNNSDAHFNYVSILEISKNIQPGGYSTCGTETPLTNHPPIANAGPDYTIPISTAYVLHGSATDPDGKTTLTYNWAENDPERAPTDGTPKPTWKKGPVYRSILPLASPDRSMPRLAAVLAGNLTPTWEVTPSVARTLNFSFIVRDNGSGFNPAVGQTDADLMQVKVSGAVGPFRVSSPKTAGTVWNVGESQTVTWDVAHTNLAPIGVSKVGIYLSTDGGTHFDIVLGDAIPNTGSFQFTVPEIAATTQARIKIVAVDNIFYAVNSTEFSIQKNPFVLNFEKLNLSVCQPEQAVYKFNYMPFQSFGGSVNLLVNGLPSTVEAHFDKAFLTEADESDQLHLTSTGTETGSYTFTIVATAANDASIKYHKKLRLTVLNNTIGPVALHFPADGFSGITLRPTFTWKTNANTEKYNLQIATKQDFKNKVVNEMLNDTSFTPSSDLELGTTYYWRVKATNKCAEADYSEIAQFTTAACFACESSGNLNYETGTTLVNFNTINNSSGKEAGYTDNTAISTNVKIGSSYNLAVKVNTAGKFTTYTRIWVDWNHNCDFNDEGEVYDLGTAHNTTDGLTLNSPLSIKIPADALPGRTQMRVSTRFKQAASPCSTNFDGDVEDYTLFVENNLSTVKKQFKNFTVWPNPNHGNFTISLTPANSNRIQVRLYDLRGRLLYQKSYPPSANFQQKIQLENASKGLYLLRITNGSANSTKKILIEQKIR